MDLERNRIVLIKPITGEPRLSFLSVQPPINLAYLAAVVREAGFEVEIWDFAVSSYSGDRLQERLLRYRPALVGITCFTPTILYGYDLADAVKEVLPGAVTAVGGPHSTALPQRTLDECPALDVVVVGEGEATFLDLAERVRAGESLSGCPGLVHRSDGKIVTEPPRPLISSLDDLPFPARDLLASERYTSVQHTRGISQAHGPLTELFTSRGCPGKCLFCAVNVNYGLQVRFRGVENVLGEVEECRRQYGIRHFVIQDDTFTLRPSRVAELMQGFRQLGVESFSCDARVDLVSREMMEDMARSGCVKISFGVESGSPRILAMNGKGITREQVRDAFRWGREAGIRLLEATFIIGSHPDENPEDLRATKELIGTIKPDILFCSAVVPYPGTEISNLLRKDGLYAEQENWADFRMFTSIPSWRTTHFSGAALARARDEVLRSYYLSPSYAFRRLKSLDSWSEAKYWLHAGLDYLRITLRTRQPM